MEKFITGIGGIFFKSADTKNYYEWMQKTFGLDCNQWGKTFKWRSDEDKEKIGTTQWSVFSKDTDYYGNSEQQFMINYRISDMEKLLAHFKTQGIELDKPMEEYEYGKFCWIKDPNGNRIELWEPIDSAFDEVE